MNILITGAKGMLAKAVIETLEKENTLVLTDANELDITDLEQVMQKVEKIQPDCIINCAAYTAVDKAEEDQELCEKINSQGAENLAIATNKIGCILIHISTDYVFGGDKPITFEYQEEEEKRPNTVYGITKLKGEEAIQKNCNNYYIFRTAWLYGDGNNFVRTMLKLGKEKESINVVDDQYGSPTYAKDLANIIKQTLEKKIPYGVYHATNIGNITWFDFTKEIFELANIHCKVHPVTTEEFPRPAKRPANSQLSKKKLLEQGIQIPNWKESLQEYIEIEQNKEG